MYDWLKVSTYKPQTMDFLLKDSGLNFTADINPDTGEIETDNLGNYIRTAEQHGLKFHLYNSGRIEVKGSLHTFFNSVVNGINGNYNTFSYNDAVQAIAMLKEMYSIDPTETTVHNIETGVNVILNLNLDVSEVLNYVKAYKSLKFNAMGTIEGFKGKKVATTQYKVKIYDKGAQYRLKDKVLRYEIGYFKMQALRRGLKLSDLTVTGVWDSLGKKLVSSLGNVLFTDDFNRDDLTVTEKNLFTFCNNPDDWEQAKKDKRYKSKEKFKQLIAAKGKYKFGDFFTGLINDKIKTISAKTGYFFTADKIGSFLSLKKMGLATFLPFNCSVKKSPSTNPNVGSITDRICTVTGLPLTLETDRRKTQVCIGVRTVRYLKEKDPVIYDLLRVQFLCRATKGFSDREPDEVAKIAKQIRNTVSNSKKYRECAHRVVPVNQLELSFGYG